MEKASDLMARARQAAALDDFGEDSFREGLEVLLAAAEAEASLTPVGEAVVQAQILDFLTQRLKIEDWYRRHPEIDEQEIVAPLIGLGLPRTGSTAFSCLLAEDPEIRFIRNWENMWPCPPTEFATQHTDPRIAEAEVRGAQSAQMAPRIKSMLPMSATSPSECQNFMGYDFKSQVFQAFARIPSYSEWLHHKADLEPTYRYVKRVLKLLQWRCPPTRWRLKNPSHMPFITALDKVFPDARYWMTHRDVTKVLPSVADLYFELSKSLTEDPDPAYLGKLNTDCWALGLERLIAFRDLPGNETRFFDVHFAPVQRDPMPHIQALYDWLGEPLTETAKARMLAWRAATPRDKHGVHEYDAASFGLDLDRLRERFRFYSDRFGVAA
jgi:hypothetical protein